MKTSFALKYLPLVVVLGLGRFHPAVAQNPVSDSSATSVQKKTADSTNKAFEFLDEYAVLDGGQTAKLFRENYDAYLQKRIGLSKEAAQAPDGHKISTQKIDMISQNGVKTSVTVGTSFIGVMYDLKDGQDIREVVYFYGDKPGEDKTPTHLLKEAMIKNADGLGTDYFSSDSYGEDYKLKSQTYSIDFGMDGKDPKKKRIVTANMMWENGEITNMIATNRSNSNISQAVGNRGVEIKYGESLTDAQKEAYEGFSESVLGLVRGTNGIVAKTLQDISMKITGSFKRDF